MNWSAVKAEMIFIRFNEENEQFFIKFCYFVINISNTLNDILCRNDLVSDIKAEHRHQHTALIDYFCSFSVHKYIKFSGRCPIAESTAAHQYNLIYIFYNSRFFN